MRTPLLIAVPAFLVGCLVTAGLTTTARAQKVTPIDSGSIDMTIGHARMVAGVTQKGKLPRYVTANTDSLLAKYGALGYEVKMASHTNNYVEYLMER